MASSALRAAATAAPRGVLARGLSKRYVAPGPLSTRWGSSLATSSRAGRELDNAAPFVTRASPVDDPEPDGEIEAARAALMRSMDVDTMDGRELRDLVFAKWGKSYDCRLQRRGPKMYLHVMWKHLEQKSFPLTEDEYQEQLDAVAEFITAWNAADIVRNGIMAAHPKGPGYTVGGNAKAISIPLPVDMSSGEW